MATISSKRIKSVLDKVRRVGRVEDTVTVSGCDLTLQNLSPKEFEDALQEIEGLEDIAYAHAFQVSQISRAIVSIDGCDLREGDFVEDEVPNQFVVSALLPTEPAAIELAERLQKEGIPVASVAPEGSKLVKLERHRWLQDNVLKDWGRETLVVVWRKFTELLVKAEDKAKNGVTFLVPDETAEDHYRRLLNELKETEEDLPAELINKLLGDAGLLQRSTVEELEAANERVAKLATGPVEPELVEQIVARPSQGVVVVPEAVQQQAASRQPLNTNAVALTSPREEPQPPPVIVPEEVRVAAVQNMQGMSSRASQIAALEGQFIDVLNTAPPGPSKPATVAELSTNAETPDPSKLEIDTPPPVGVNPRFNPRYR